MWKLPAGPGTVLPDALVGVFGRDGEAMDAIEMRARAAFPDSTPIVWECDASSFNFGYVNDAAAELLGFSKERWLEPKFWSEQVVAAEDRDDTVAYCALATARGRDHIFEYRAHTADGGIVWLRDFVKVVVRPGTSSTIKLRGVMIDITAEKLGQSHPTPEQRPSRLELDVAAP